jgi:hypothetical protein
VQGPRQRDPRAQRGEPEAGEVEGEVNVAGADREGAAREVERDRQLERGGELVRGAAEQAERDAAAAMLESGDEVEVAEDAAAKPQLLPAEQQGDRGGARRARERGAGRDATRELTAKRRHERRQRGDVDPRELGDQVAAAVAVEAAVDLEGATCGAQPQPVHVDPAAGRHDPRRTREHGAKAPQAQVERVEQDGV